MANLNLTINSTVKHITSGTAPTTSNLSNGELAFGIVGGKQHLYGNDSGSIIDILLAGNPINVVQVTGTSTTDVLSQKAVSDLIIAVQNDIDDVETALGLLSDNVLQKDNTTAYTPTANYHPATFKYVNDSIASIGNVFVLKGRVDTYENLPSSGNKIGDVWLVGLEEATEMDEYVWTSANTWEKFGKTQSVDLSNYYTKAEIDSLFANYYTKSQTEALIPTKTSDLNNDSDFVADASYVHTDNNYLTADKNKVAIITTTGDGTKILTDDGSYGTLSVTVNIPTI